MKKLLSLVLASVLFAAVLVACGGGAQSSSSSSGSSGAQSSSSSSSSASSDSSSSGGAVVGSGKDYEAVIRAARPDDINELAMYDPATNVKTALYNDPTDELMEQLVQEQKDYAKENGETLSDDEAMEYAEASVQRYLTNVDYLLSTTFKEGGVAQYAICAPGIITIAYGVMIILPEEGKTDLVVQQLEEFVEGQQKACENYLKPQYEIAKAAVIETAPTGEVLLAMCEDSATVMQKMLAGLAE